MTIGVLVFGVAMATSSPRDAEAGCNVIPQTTTAYRSVLGTTDRPYAAPANVVRVQLTPCDTASARYGSAFVSTTDVDVTIIYKSPSGAISTQTVPPSDVTIVDGSTLGIAMPVPAVPKTGPATIVATLHGAPVPPALLGNGNCAAVPCTSGVGTPCTDLVFCVDDLYMNDGSVCPRLPNITFTGFTALPEPNDYAQLCIDTDNLDGPCTGTAGDGLQVRMTIDQGGNLLIPVAWQGILPPRTNGPVPRLLLGTSNEPAFLSNPPAGHVAGEPITLPGNTFVASLTPEGRPLDPIFNPLVDPTATVDTALFGSVDAIYTVLRVARRSLTFRECAGGDHDGLPCNNDDECPAGSCGFTSCFSRTDHRRVSPATTCASDVQCPNGGDAHECGPSLFDFSDRLAGGGGPVLVSRSARTGSATYSLEANEAVPLGGLLQTKDLYAFVVDEALQGPTGADLDGDGDTIDPVVTLRSRVTGHSQHLGGTAPGLAATLVSQPPYRKPAIGVGGHILAFLESEPLQHYLDLNGNGRVFDSILRVFRLVTPSPGGELTAGFSPPIAADAAAVINGRSVLVGPGGGCNPSGHVCTLDPSATCTTDDDCEGQLVYFRAAEAARSMQTTRRMSVGLGGTEGSPTGAVAGASGASISADGRFVVFASDFRNLVASDMNGVADVFVHDRDSDGNGVLDEPSGTTTTLVSVDSNGVQANGASGNAKISADGRFVAFESSATNLDLVTADANGAVDVFVHDLATGATVRVSVAYDGTEAPAGGRDPAISANGRHVAFVSAAADLGQTQCAAICLPTGAANGKTKIYVRDRDRDGNGLFDEPSGSTTKLVSLGADFGEPAEDSSSPAISGDGRFVAFATAGSLVDSSDFQSDTNGVSDVFVHDRDFDENGVFDEPRDEFPSVYSGTETATTTRISIAPDLASLEADGASTAPSISSDGRYVAFTSVATNLVSNDTDGAADVFVYDRDADGNHVFDEDRSVGFSPLHSQSYSMTRVSVASDGTQGAGTAGLGAVRPMLSPDGRYTAFASDFSDLVPGDGNGRPDVFVHDNLTGMTTRVSVPNGGGDGSGGSTGFVGVPAVASEARYVAFDSACTNLVAGGDANGLPDVFVRGADQSGDSTGNGPSETLLNVLHTASSALEAISPVAGTVSVLGTSVAYLLPERGNGAGTDLNGDGDRDDDVVQLRRNGTVENLQRAATEVAHSDAWVAALVAETGQFGQDLNGDGDTLDGVVAVHDASDSLPSWTMIPAPARCTGRTGQAGHGVAVSGSVVAFIASEIEEACDINGDGDQRDNILQVYRLGPGGPVAIGPDGAPANEFVLGSDVLAFRTTELLSCNGNLYRGNCTDFSRGTGCHDPAECDLDGDGDCCDVVLRALDLTTDTLVNSKQTATTCRLEACDPSEPYRVRQSHVCRGGLKDLRPCSTGTDCPADSRFPTAPAPSCVTVNTVRFLTRECEQSCDAAHTHGGGDPTKTCAPASPGEKCGSLSTEGTDLDGNGFGDDLVIQALDIETAQTSVVGRVDDAEPQGNPLDAAPFGSDVGRCVSTGTTGCTATSCPTGSTCAAGTGCVLLVPGTCGIGGACPANATCRTDLGVTMAMPDADGDGVTEPPDDCPTVSNPDQLDTDGDGVGDACDASTCGDGVLQSAEQCDDGNTLSGDGCDATCHLELNDLECLEIHRPPFARAGVPLVDRFGGGIATIKRAKRICAPADRDGADPTAPGDPEHYTAYTIKQTSPARSARIRGVTVTTGLGSFTVDVGKPDRLLVPTAKSLTATPPALTTRGDDYKCYRVKGAKLRQPNVTLETQFGSLSVDVKAPVHLCAPVDLDGSGIRQTATSLMCFKVQGPVPQVPDTIYTTNLFGSDRYAVYGARELCIPATASQ